MANINIFYSWQSDLPGAETRNFIQSCIDAAVKTLKDTVYVEANRDTRGNYGSPDITNVIFEKIQQCDIFVADVSIINSEHYELNENGEYVQIQKLSPNPNVLLELGYAAGVIGWENIICIANEDYGNANCMPFDLEHRRLTFYTLNNKDKAVVRKNIRNIIADTVMNVIENGVRPKNGMAAYRIGSYVNGEIVSDIVKYNPINSDYLKKNYDAWIKKIKSLVDEINTICTKQLLTVLPPVFLMFLRLFFINYRLIYFLFFFLVSFQYQKTKKRTLSTTKGSRVRFSFSYLFYSSNATRSVELVQV